MKIMIASSGGLDSTALLYETLRDTTHEVVAVHFNEEPYLFGRPGRHEREAEAFNATTVWLKANVRTFEAVHGPIVTSDSAGVAYDIDEWWPTRPGFRHRRAMYWAKCRYASISVAATTHEADMVQIAETLWNRRGHDDIREMYYDAYRDHGSVPFDFPFVTKDPETGIWSGRSRLGNYHALPEDLLALVASCYRETIEPNCSCLCCVPYRFWRTVAEPNWDRIEDIELRCEQKGFFGRHYDDADPETFRYVDLWDSLADLDEWRTWLAETAP